MNGRQGKGARAARAAKRLGDHTRGTAASTGRPHGPKAPNPSARSPGRPQAPPEQPRTLRHSHARVQRWRSSLWRSGLVRKSAAPRSMHFATTSWSSRLDTTAREESGVCRSGEGGARRRGARPCVQRRARAGPRASGAATGWALSGAPPPPRVPRRRRPAAGGRRARGRRRTDHGGRPEVLAAADPPEQPERVGPPRPGLVGLEDQVIAGAVGVAAERLQRLRGRAHGLDLRDSFGRTRRRVAVALWAGAASERGPASAARFRGCSQAGLRQGRPVRPRRAGRPFRKRCTPKIGPPGSRNP